MMNMIVGYELNNYRSFMESVLTLVKVIFGEADFGELMEVDNRVFALIVFGMYCVTVFFIILSMFFAMVSAAQARTRVFSAQTRPRPPRDTLDRIQRAADRDTPRIEAQLELCLPRRRPSRRRT